ASIQARNAAMSAWLRSLSLTRSSSARVSSPTLLRSKTTRSPSRNATWRSVASCALPRARRPIERRFRRRRDEDRVEGVMAIVGNALSVFALLEALQVEGAAQPAVQDSRPCEHASHAGAVSPTLARRIERFQSLGEQTAGPARVVEIALAKSPSERLCVLEQKIALFPTLDRQGADLLDEFSPGLRRLLAFEPLEGGAVALASVGLRQAQCLVRSGVVAKSAPGEDVIDLHAVAAGQELRRVDRFAAVDATSVLLAPQFESQQLFGSRSAVLRGPSESLPKGHPQLPLLGVPPDRLKRHLPARFGRFADLARELDMDAVGNAMALHHRLDLLDSLGQRLARGRAFDQLARNPPLREDALQSLLAGGADVESALLPRRGGIVTRGETSLVVGESLLEARDELSCCPGGNMRGARKQAEPSRLGRRVERFDERGRRA